MTYDEFRGDRRLQGALVKLIEIIGEAAARLSADARSRVPVPWDQIVAMRHRLVHDYVNIDYGIVWYVATDDLPALIAAVAPLLPPQDDDDSRAGSGAQDA